MALLAEAAAKAAAIQAKNMRRIDARLLGDVDIVFCNESLASQAAASPFPLQAVDLAPSAAQPASRKEA